METKIVVVGAGISGLYAAYLLVQKKFKNVVVLEAQDRVGGRVQSVRTKDGQNVDVGGQWIHGLGENPLWKFVQQNEVRIMYKNCTLFHCKKNAPFVFTKNCKKYYRARDPINDCCICDGVKLTKQSFDPLPTIVELQCHLQTGFSHKTNYVKNSVCK